MTLTIPLWLLYTFYGIGALLGLGVVAFVVLMAWVGFMFCKAFSGGMWR